MSDQFLALSSNENNFCLRSWTINPFQNGVCSKGMKPILPFKPIRMTYRAKMTELCPFARWRELFSTYQLRSIKQICSIKVVHVVLLFYVHGKHLRSCRDGQLT